MFQIKYTFKNYLPDLFQQIKTKQILEENIVISSWLWIRGWFLRYDTKSTNNWGIDKLNSIKIKMLALHKQPWRKSKKKKKRKKAE